jgi:signal transduction histidine kinase
MKMRFRKYFVLCFLFISLVFQSYADGLPKEGKNVLLINSYHPGYVWTDSLTSGIISKLQLHPEIHLYVEYLYSKQFGQSNFEIEKAHIQNKYAKISFSGILVTDNDALDFVFKYKASLFPNQPIVFAGIPNPDDYPLKESQCYGFPETGNSGSVLKLIRELLPESKRILVITDMTTTGLVYRKEFKENASKIKDFTVDFPPVIDLDSIYEMVKTNNVYDAIYYFGIGLDKYGNLIEFGSVLNTISQMTTIPLLCNGQQVDRGDVLGGLYQSGKKLGVKTAELLIQLMDPTIARPDKPYFEDPPEYFFDQRYLDKYNIPKSRIPEGSKVINAPQFPIRKYFLGLIGALMILLGIVLFLFGINRRMKKAEREITKQFKQIQTQNTELSDAYDQLSRVTSELESTNSQLIETNRNLSVAKKKAEESDNLKSAFLANVSHEIRTPLNSIVGFSSLLTESGVTEETRKSYMELIESNSESLLVLIDEIIDLSKIEAQQLTIKKQEFSIDLLMKELFQVFSRSHQNTEVELIIPSDSDKKELLAYSDRVRVNQIFTNLLSNAYKFTSSGLIEIGYLLSENQTVQLYVKDSGIGIHEEFHKVIFDRFRKLNVDENKLYRGTGLGLAITKKLVELLGGQIWISSEPGKGTTFYFTLEGLELRDVLS